jgi:hypothetical protein
MLRVLRGSIFEFLYFVSFVSFVVQALRFRSFEDPDPMQKLASLIRAVPDFPTPGIVFRDITPLLADAAEFARCIALLAEPWREARVQAVSAIESRGII